MHQLLGFSGPAGSGKDTCGNLLCDRHNFIRLSFAAPIYQALRAMGFGWPKTQDEKERIIPWLGRSWRDMAQTLGTEWGREKVHPDLWIMLALNSMVNDLRYVITDVRFENEARAIREHGGQVVHLRGRKHPMAAGTAQHASEKLVAVEPGDIVLDNSGSIFDLNAAINDIVRR